MGKLRHRKCTAHMEGGESRGRQEGLQSRFFPKEVGDGYSLKIRALMNVQNGVMWHFKRETS